MLLARIAAGDEKAFAELFNAHHNEVAEYVLMVVSSPELTAEIVQDVFMKLWTNRQELVHIDNFTCYLFIITRNYTLNCLKKMARDRRKEAQYKQHLSDAAGAADPHASTQEYLSLIDQAVARLSPQQQKVYLLSRQEGLKYAEIADRMGISRETVKKYIQLALKTITGFVKTQASFLITCFFL
jgi:RNA polymerase sigma-70 factor (family 1)